MTTNGTANNLPTSSAEDKGITEEQSSLKLKSSHDSSDSYYDSFSEMDKCDVSISSRNNNASMMNESFVTAMPIPQDTTSCSLFEDSVLEEDGHEQGDYKSRSSLSLKSNLSQVKEELCVVNDEDSPSSMIQMDEVTLDHHKLVMDKLQIHEVDDDDGVDGSSNDGGQLEGGTSPQHQYDLTESRVIDELRNDLAESRRRCSELEIQIQQNINDFQRKLTENTIEVTSAVTGKVTLAMSERINTAEKLAKEREIELERLQKETNEEFEEVILSLDKVESEYGEKIVHLQAQLEEKEVAYSRLSKSFTELRATIETSETKLLQTDMELQSSKVQNSSLQLELEKSKKSFARALEEEKQLRQVEVENAKSNLRLAAEQQFGEANKLYLKLKSDHERILDENKYLLVENKKLEALCLAANKKEAEILSEIARLRADIANAEADHAKIAHEMIEQKEYNESELEKRRIETEAVHKSLAVLVAEKERLLIENKELSNVCEELMGLVESNDQN